MKLSISNATRFKKMPRNQILALMLQIVQRRQQRLFEVALLTTKLGGAF